MSAAKTRTATSMKTWLVRASIAIVVGLSIGAGGGVVAVRTLEPGRPEAPDSLQLMLDSLAKGTVPGLSDSRATRRATDSSAAAERERRYTDSITTARLPTTVPDVIGLEEGVARTRIAEARLAVGVVQLEDSRTAAGTVLRTDPIAGETLKANASVSLVLSSGRMPPNDAPRSLPFPAPTP